MGFLLVYWWRRLSLSALLVSACCPRLGQGWPVGLILASLAKSPDPASPGPGAALLSISPVTTFKPIRTECAAVCYIPLP
jgi:hypothetical protein